VSTPTDVTLRPPAAADVDEMLALVEACDETWREWTPPDWQPPPPGSARWVRELGAADRWTRLAVDPSGAIVGLVSWGAAHDEPGWRPVPGTAQVAALFVHPAAWRRGIAARLLDSALAAMREQGFERARLHTPDGAPAERFYRAAGWRRDGDTHWNAVVRLRSVQYVREL
jgi:GNAT superfamily N-acetyltransferase